MAADHPTRLGRYELREELGRGGMGVVYKAYDSLLDRTVAVKTFRQDTEVTEEVRRRFERGDVRAASKLHHTNIVIVHDAGFEDGIPFVAMEYVEGPTLEAEIKRRGRLPVEEAVQLIVGISEGLACAHAHGVIHRDLKPANILLSPGGEPKITDFGLAKLTRATGGGATSTMVVGTPSYMAPEQIEGKSFGAPTDVFGLAVLSYELLVGQRPFTAEGWMAILFQIANVEPEPPTKIDPKLPEEIDEVFARALRKDPAKRTPDARTFAVELEQAFAAAKSAGQTTAILKKGEDRAPGRSMYPSTPNALRGLGGKPWVVPSIVTATIAAGGLIAFLTRHPFEPSAPAALPAVATTTPTEVAPPSTPFKVVVPTERPTELPTANPSPSSTSTPAPKPTASPPPDPTSTPRPKATSTPRPTRVPTQPTLPGREATQPPTVSRPSASPAYLTIASQPPGATVRVNGKNLGRTPFTLGPVPPGRYEVSVELDGFSSQSRGIDLRDGAMHQIEFRFSAN